MVVLVARRSGSVSFITSFVSLADSSRLQVHFQARSFTSQSTAARLALSPGSPTPFVYRASSSSYQLQRNTPSQPSGQASKHDKAERVARRRSLTRASCPQCGGAALCGRHQQLHRTRVSVQPSETSTCTAAPRSDALHHTLSHQRATPRV